jgi:hypothetical protein
MVHGLWGYSVHEKLSPPFTGPCFLRRGTERESSRCASVAGHWAYRPLGMTALPQSRATPSTVKRDRTDCRPPRGTKDTGPWVGQGVGLPAVRNCEEHLAFEGGARSRPGTKHPLSEQLEQGLNDLDAVGFPSVNAHPPRILWARRLPLTPHISRLTPKLPQPHHLPAAVPRAAEHPRSATPYPNPRRASLRPHLDR